MVFFPAESLMVFFPCTAELRRQNVVKESKIYTRILVTAFPVIQSNALKILYEHSIILSLTSREANRYRHPITGFYNQLSVGRQKSTFIQLHSCSISESKRWLYNGSFIGMFICFSTSFYWKCAQQIYQKFDLRTSRRCSFCSRSKHVVYA